jgi:hypothetical protein
LFAPFDKIFSGCNYRDYNPYYEFIFFLINCYIARGECQNRDISQLILA